MALSGQQAAVQGRAAIDGLAQAVLGVALCGEIITPIIGAASLSGGRASVVRTLTGAALIAVLNNGMVLLNANNDAQYIVISSRA